MGLFGTLGSWIEEPFDWTTKEVGDLASWTISQLIKAVGFNQSDIKKVGTDVFTFVSKAIYGVTQVINSAISEVHHTITLIDKDLGEVASTVGSLSKWVGNAEHWVQARITSAVGAFEHDVIVPIEHELSTVAHSAAQTVQAGISTITADITSLEHTVITPISTWISNAGSWFETEFSSAWGTVENDVIGPIKTVTNYVEHTLPGIVTWIEHDAMAAVKTVEEAGDWLIKFAEHPISDIETMISDIFNKQSLDAVIAAATKEIGNTGLLDRFLADLIGE